MMWARRLGCPWDEGVCIAAAEIGELDLLQWVIWQGYAWNERSSQQQQYLVMWWCWSGSDHGCSRKAIYSVLTSTVLHMRFGFCYAGGQPPAQDFL